MDRLNYRKMKPDPIKRMRICEGILGWNLIGRVTKNDIKKFVDAYTYLNKRTLEYYKEKAYGNVRLVDICGYLHMTRACFLDILISIMWSRIAFRKKYGGEPRVTNIVLSIDTSSHMLYQDKMNDEHLTMGYHFKIDNYNNKSNTEDRP